MKNKNIPPKDPQPVEQIGKLKDNQIALQESIERFEYLAKATNDAIWDWNIETNRVYTNEAFNKLFGKVRISREALINYIFSVVHPDDYVASREFIVNVMAGGSEFWTYECRIRKPDNTYAYIVNKATVIRDANGKAIRMIGAMQDITERKQYEESLEKLNRELIATNNELEQFAYIASHDLQEPLRMVSSFLGLIEKKYGNVIGEKGREYIHYATDGAARMRNVISDILEFSKIGRLVEPNIEVDLNQLMREICLLKKEVIKEQKAEIKYQSLPTIQSQKTLLLQLFYNLISNALKYHQSDKCPIIELSCTDKGDFWEFAIKDNGIGIEEAYFLKIFEAFQRLHSKDEYSGSGIGLAICKKIVQILKGDIWVESIPGNGSIFYVSLPKI